MPSPYERRLSGSFNDVWIAPSPTPNVFTMIRPAGGLTRSGVWVPWLLNDDGTPVFPGQGTPNFDDALATTDPGVLQSLITGTVPAGITRSLMQMFVITRAVGAFQVLANDELIGGGRTGPAGIGRFSWTPPRPLVAASTYEVRFLSSSSSPAQDVEAYVQATDTTS